MAQGVGQQAGPPLAFGLLKAVAGILLVIKLALIALPAPFMDEAYYWLWGQHPALSYYDHPPLSAWLEGLAGMLFGWNTIGLRAPVVLTLAGDIFVLALFARRQPGDRQASYFWSTLVLFLATPIFL